MMEEEEMVEGQPTEAAQPTQSIPEQPKALKILQGYMEMPNIADVGDEALRAAADTTLAEIGQLVLREFQYDDESRAEWLKRMQEGINLARQLKEGRTWAGEAVADVRYPTVASAAIQYAARAYPGIVKDKEVVKFQPVGADPEGVKSARGARVAHYLNWELLENIDNWEEDMDKLLFMQPIIGTYFKKTYYDPVDGRVCVHLVDPEDLVLYYKSASFDSVPRKTEIMYLAHNEYVEQVRMGLFIDLELPRPDEQEGGLHEFLEQHRVLDLDGDGYDEPYIVTIHKDTGKVARIVARFEQNGIKLNPQGEIARIEAIEYYTEYPFMPSFDGGIYGMGFGILLGPINESINTLFNQLLDSGTRANYQSGFIGRGVRLIRGGEGGAIKFKRGEWKQITASGDDLRRSIFPLPTTEPSAVLFQLLGFLVQASKELSSQSELLAGSQSQHNVPATSTLALIEQGLKVFSGIYKRCYRALKKEYRKVHHLLALHIKQEAYTNVVDDPQANIADFVEQDYDIVPVSTAESVTETQKYMKAQALLQLVQGGSTLDRMEVDKFYLESLGIPDVQRFMPKGPPQPPWQFQVAMRELDIRDKEVQLKMVEVNSRDAKTAAEIRELRERMVKLRADAVKSLADAEAAEAGDQSGIYKKQVADILDELWVLEQQEQAKIAQEQQQAAMRQQQMQQAQPPQQAPGGPAGPVPPAQPMPQ